MKIPRYIRLALELLHKANYEAYIVGGAVRDFLLNHKPNDFDIATSALPMKIIQVFSKYKTIDIGIKHGTVGVILYNKLVEITTFRVDEDYQDFRHPMQVRFVDRLKDDLSRRDFTINALAYHNEVIDYFGGVNDLKNGIIRCVGNPEIRFTEDVLRILRGMRFACQYNFHIEDNTSEAIFKYKHLLSRISSERIALEINKMLSSDITIVLKPYLSVFQEVLPELIENTIDDKISRLTKSNNNLIVRTAILIYDFENPEITLDSLRSSKLFKKKVMAVLKNQDLIIKEDVKALAKLLSKFPLEDIINIEAFNNTFREITNIEKILPLVKDIPKSLTELNIKGNELINLGLKKTPEISRILNELLYKVIDGELQNNNNDLKGYVINNYL